MSKRVTVRSSRFNADVVPETAMVPVSIGRLFITNRRVVFRGNTKSFSLPLTSIMGVAETFSDAIRLTSERSEKPRIVRFSETASAEQVREVLAAMFDGGDQDQGQR